MALTISLQTIRTNVAGTLKSIKPDADGYYVGVPLMVLGAVSRNNIYYEPDSVVKAMTNPKSRFFAAITGGGLEGEWGHPSLVGLDDTGILQRLSDVDARFVSHHFRRIYTEQKGEFTLLRGDVKAVGPYGTHLTQSFEDPNRDTCFSLRSLTSQPIRRGDGVGVKKVINLTTYDYVTVPGYIEASKRGMVGNESFDNLIWEDIDLKVFSNNVLENLGDKTTSIIGYESIHCQQILDILGTDDVKVSFESTPLGVLDTKTGKFTGVHRQVSPTHTFLNKRSL